MDLWIFEVFMEGIIRSETYQAKVNQSAKYLGVNTFQNPIGNFGGPLVAILNLEAGGAVLQAV